MLVREDIPVREHILSISLPARANAMRLACSLLASHLYPPCTLSGFGSRLLYPPIDLCVCVCVYVCERERERSGYACARERDVCMRERERDCVCVCDVQVCEMFLCDVHVCACLSA
jgi:hypothetical protein